MLTEKQRELLLYIEGYKDEHQIFPSFDEMRLALSLKSKSGIHRLITGLVERGYLRQLPRKARALELVKGAVEKVKEGIDNNTLRIPMLGSIAAGLPIEAIQNNAADIPGIDYMDLPMGSLSSRKSYYGLQVNGDSMMEAGIYDGDLAIIARQQTAHNGDIVVALVGNEDVTLKYYHGFQKRVELRPANEAFEVQTYRPGQVAIQGKLAMLIRSY